MFSVFSGNKYGNFLKMQMTADSAFDYD